MIIHPIVYKKVKGGGEPTEGFSPLKRPRFKWVYLNEYHEWVHSYSDTYDPPEEATDVPAYNGLPALTLGNTYYPTSPMWSVPEAELSKYEHIEQLEIGAYYDTDYPDNPCYIEVNIPAGGGFCPEIDISQEQNDFDVEIEWGDGSPNYTASKVTHLMESHEYVEGGRYIIKISTSPMYERNNRGIHIYDYYGQFTRIYLGRNLTLIGEDAYMYAFNLEFLIFSSVPIYQRYISGDRYIGFSNKLDALVLPPNKEVGLEVMQDDFISSLPKLRSITFPPYYVNWRQYSNRLISHCSLLEQIVFPKMNQWQQFGNGFLENLPSLMELVLPFEGIYNYSAWFPLFTDCPNLQRIILPTNNVVECFLTEDDLDEVHPDLEIYVPANLVNSYKQATNWNSSLFVDRIKALPEEA